MSDLIVPTAADSDQRIKEFAIHCIHEAYLGLANERNKYEYEPFVSNRGLVIFFEYSGITVDLRPVHGDRTVWTVNIKADGITVLRDDKFT